MLTLPSDENYKKSTWLEGKLRINLHQRNCRTSKNEWYDFYLTDKTIRQIEVINLKNFFVQEEVTYPKTTPLRFCANWPSLTKKYIF